MRLKHVRLAFLLMAFMTLSAYAGEFSLFSGDAVYDCLACSSSDRGCFLGEKHGDQVGCPTWDFRVNYAQFWRARTGGDRVLLSNTQFQGGVLTETPIYSLSQFEFSGPGIDSSIAWSSGGGHGLELRYLGAQNFSESWRFPGGNGKLPGSTTNFGGPIRVSYDSGLESLELLGFCRPGESRFTLGFRYVEIAESLTYAYAGPPLPFVVPDYLFHRAKNGLYGCQLGWDGAIWERDRLRIEGQAKAGIYLNDLRVSSAQLTTISSSLGRNSSSETAFVSELGIGAAYDFRSNLCLECGYQTIFVDGVSLAADQSVNTSNLAVFAPATVDIDQNSLFFHAMRFGLEYRY